MYSYLRSIYNQFKRGIFLLVYFVEFRNLLQLLNQTKQWTLLLRKLRDFSLNFLSSDIFLYRTGVLSQWNHIRHSISEYVGINGEVEERKQNGYGKFGKNLGI